jgi:hypothetical protein
MEEDDGEAKPINAGDVIQLFHKDTDCYVSAEGVFRDPLAKPETSWAGASLAEDMHLRNRAPNEAKPNRLKPPTSAVSYFQVEHAEAYEGGPISWNMRVWCSFLPISQFPLATKVYEGVILATEVNEGGPISWNMRVRCSFVIEVWNPPPLLLDPTMLCGVISTS